MLAPQSSTSSFATGLTLGPRRMCVTGVENESRHVIWIWPLACNSQPKTDPHLPPLEFRCQKALHFQARSELLSPAALPAQARGKGFPALAARRKAGLSEELIAAVKSARPRSIRPVRSKKLGGLFGWAEIWFSICVSFMSALWWVEIRMLDGGLPVYRKLPVLLDVPSQ